MIVRCRACVKCKQYVIIHPDNPINQLEIKNFEKIHLNHTIMTVGLGEVKGIYSNFKTSGGDKPPKEEN